MNKMVFAFKRIFKKKVGRIDSKWNFDTNSLILSSPIIADVNDSGEKEIIIGTSTGKIYSLNLNGKINWVFSAEEKYNNVQLMFLDEDTAHSINSPPNVQDINGDGKKEIVFGTESGTLYCLGSDGKLLWKIKTAGSIRSSALIADINKDKKKEIVFGSTDKRIYIINSNGKIISKYELKSSIESSPAFIDGQIIFGTDDGLIYSISPTGTVFWKYKTNGKITAQPAIAKIYGDNEEYIIIGSTDCFLYVLDKKGALKWNYKTEGAILSKACIADINDDKKLEIIFGSCDDNVYALSCDGEKLWSFETDFWVVASPIVADIDNDGKKEIIVGSYDHNIYILDSAGSYILDYVPGISGAVNQAGHYSELMTQEPGRIHGKKLWQFQTEGIIVGCASIDENRNIIVNTQIGTVKNIVHKEV